MERTTQVSINRQLIQEDVVWVYVCIYSHTHTHTHRMEYYSTIKMNEILPFTAAWMDLNFIILSEVSKTERQILYDYHLYVESKK